MEATATTTATGRKIARIAELCEALGWVDMTDHEALMETTGRMYNRGAITDALQTYLEEAGRVTRRTAEVVRVSYRHADYEGITVHAETWNGKIHSAAYTYFGKATTSLTGIIRELEHEQMLASHRAAV